MKYKEYDLQKQVCAYLNAKWPEVLFMTDSIAAVKLTLPQAARNKSVQKDGFKCPDLIILQPNRYFHGLFIELKKESPYKKTGGLKKCKHLEAQQKTIDRLDSLEYFACFAWSYEMVIEIIENYLNNKL